MADRPQVVKLAQPGIDVKSAGDENLVYNSNWPLLKIYKQGSFTTTDTHNSPQTIINHDLGYAPMFWVFSNNNITDWNTDAGIVASRAEFNGPIIDGFPVSTKSQLVYAFQGAAAQTTKFYYYIFALDLSVPYQAPIIKSGGVVGPRNTNTVFKLAKPDKDIKSSNLEDYTVNSLARSPMIHAVYPGVIKTDSSFPGGAGFTFYHNLGYAPMFFAYGYASPKNPDFLSYTTAPVGYILLRPDGTGASGFKVDEQKIQYFDPNPGRKITLVILKDPFNIDYSISVTI